MTKCRMSLLVAIVLMSIVANAQKFTVANADGVKIKYEVISAIDKTVQIIDGERADELIIPSTVEYNGNTYRVISIKKGAFRPATKFAHRIRRLVLPEGLVEIGKEAFYMAFKSDGNESIYIPSSVITIGKNAFAKHGMAAVNRECQLENLPAIVNTISCEQYGLAKKSVTSYWATHTPRIEQLQTTYAQNISTQPAVAAQKEVKRPSSDVDQDLPINSSENTTTFAVIFANENYAEEVNVDYALNDGEMFKEYCHKVLGLPEDNVHIRKDATLNNIKAEISWMQQVAKAYNGKARFIVFYAGHGIPDEASKTAYLLPVDGKGTMLDTGYSLAKLYEQLGNMPAERVTVFMDACFSGSKRGEGMLASARGVAIKAKQQAPQGKMVVFSAASGDETAYPLKDKEHGLFTYYLLKKLKETKGDVTYGELGSYITEQVSRKSIVSNGKSQSPTVTPSQNVAGTWKTMKLK